MSNVTTQIGATIRLCRAKRGFHQKQLANRADVSVSYLSLLEQGKRTCNLGVLERIAKGLDIPLFILVFLATDKTELAALDRSIAERLSYIAWQLIDRKPEGIAA